MKHAIKRKSAHWFNLGHSLLTAMYLCFVITAVIHTLSFPTPSLISTSARMATTLLHKQPRAVILTSQLAPPQTATCRLADFRSLLSCHPVGSDFHNFFIYKNPFPLFSLPGPLSPPPVFSLLPCLILLVVIMIPYTLHSVAYFLSPTL